MLHVRSSEVTDNYTDRIRAVSSKATSLFSAILAWSARQLRSDATPKAILDKSQCASHTSAKMHGKGPHSYQVPSLLHTTALPRRARQHPYMLRSLVRGGVFGRRIVR